MVSISKCKKDLNKIYLALVLLVGLSVGNAARAVPLSAVEIDRIELSGVVSVEGSSVQGVLEVSPGDRLERAKVVRSAHALETYYRARGFERIKVRSEFSQVKGESGQLENTLHFRVEEGLPTRVLQVAVIPETVRSEAFVEFWRIREARFVQRLVMKPGGILDQESLSSARRSLEDALAAESFIGAKVRDVRIIDAAAPSPANAQLGLLRAARWVHVDLMLDVGDRVSFGFRGNRVFDRSQLEAFIEEQRAVGLSREYIPTLRHRIEEEYRRAGYANVAIETFTHERPERQERHVTFEINEGARATIQELRFDGNEFFSSKELTQEFYARATNLVQRRVFVQKDLEKSAEFFVEWLKSRGFLSAKVVNVKSTLPAGGPPEARVLIYLYEGDQTKVQSVQLEGADAFPREDLLSLLGVAEQAPLNLFAFNEGLEKIKSFYRSRGYLDVKIENENSDSVIRYRFENREADIHLKLSEGPQFRVARIDVSGLTSTLEAVVRRELRFQVDEILEEPLMSESESALRRLGIFSLVAIRAIEDPSDSQKKIVEVSVQEGTPGILAGGLGLRNDLGARVFGQVGYTNLWRSNHGLFLSANLNRRFDEEFCATDKEKQAAPDAIHCFIEYQLQLAYIWPWFAFGETTFRPRLTLERTQYENFDATTLAFTNTWERRLLKSINLSGTFTYSLERTQQYNAKSDYDNAQLTIGAIIPGLRLDLRDSPLAPTQGWFASTSFELASPWLLSQVEPAPVAYTRFQFRLDRFTRLFAGITWYVSARFGFERDLVTPPEGMAKDDPLITQYQIPLIKQFSLGGAGSLRGYNEQELNLQGVAILGTASYANYRTQIDFPVAGPMRFGPFLDAANLNYDKFSFGGLRYGAGVGFHYLSPVGPVNFDWGFKINPREGDKELYRFYFSIGVI